MRSAHKGEGWMISFEPHNIPIRWAGVFMSTLKMEKLRPRELKFLAVHHRRSKERDPRS